MAAIEAFWLQASATFGQGTYGEGTYGGFWGPLALPAPVVPGNALGTFYVQALAEFPTPCQCHKGRPTKACALHCRLIEDRQRHEDELLVLALV